MWHNIWLQVPPDEVPIKHVTNGIHTRSWLAPDLQFVLDRYLSDKWQTDPTDQTVWEGVMQIPDEELWRAHERCRERLVGWTRQTLKDQLTKRRESYDELSAAEEVLDPEALTIGFARRFATYKRGALLLRDTERLKRLLEDTKRPVQFVFAGKAHPADHEGKELIKTIVNFARSNPQLRRRMVFVENYDMNVARYLVHGVDVWLNNPRRPYEASGTSGMKASLNGVPNLSVLDGWWAEGYNGKNGWEIGDGQEYGNPDEQDWHDVQSLYSILEQQVVPLFYNRDASGLPTGWVNMMKEAIVTCAPQFSMARQVKEYTEMFYVPAMEKK